MKRNRMKRFFAMLLAVTMILQQTGFTVLAEELSSEAVTEQGEALETRETKAEPEAEAKAAAESEAAAKAASESEAAAKAAAESEAAAKAAAESEAAAKAAAESEAAAKAAAESEAAAKAAAESEAASEAAKAESEAASEAAKAESEKATEAQETAAPETETEAQTQTEETAAETETATETVTEAVTETETEAVQTEMAIEAETVKETELVTEAETEVETEAVTEAESESETETETPKTEFTYEDSRVMIKAYAEEKANLPQDAELKADYLEPGSAQYNDAVAKIEAQLGTQLSGNPEKASYEYVLYDIYFLSTEENRRVEPEDGNVRVEMTFRTPVRSEAEAADENVEVVNREMVHVDNNGQAEIVTDQINTTEDGAVTSAVFTQDSFSPTGIILIMEDTAEELELNADVRTHPQYLDFGPMITSAKIEIDRGDGQGFQEVTSVTKDDLAKSVRVAFTYNTGTNYITNQDELTYTFPIEFKATETQVGNITDDSDNPIGTYSIGENNTLTVKFDYPDERNNISGKGSFSGSFNLDQISKEEGDKTFKFGDVEVKVHFPDRTEQAPTLEVTKSVATDGPEQRNLTYTVTVKNNGKETLHDIKVEDLITARSDYTTFPDTITPSKGTIQVNSGKYGFTWTGIELAPNESTSVTYKVEIKGKDGKPEDPWEYNSNNNSGDSNMTVTNKATATSGDLKSEAEIGTVYHKVWLFKGQAVYDVDDVAKARAHYYIHVNESGNNAPMKDMTGETITDTVSKNQEIQWPIKFKAFNNSNGDKKYVSNGVLDLYANDVSYSKETNSWSYKIPAQYGSCYLEFDYDTKIVASTDSTGKDTLENVGNTVGIGTKWKDSTKYAINSSLTSLALTKAAVSAEGNKVHWKSTISTKIQTSTDNPLKYKDHPDKSERMWFKPDQLNLHVYKKDGTELALNTDYKFEKCEKGEFIIVFLTNQDPGVYLAYDMFINTDISGDNDKKYKNDGEVFCNGLSTTAEAYYEYDHKLKKTGVYTETTAPFVKYTIEINPAGDTINNGVAYTMTDMMTGMSLKPSSVKVTPSEGITIDKANDHLILRNIPDGTPVTVEYLAKVNGDIGDSQVVANTASLECNGTTIDYINTEKEVVVKESLMTGDATTGTYYLYKNGEDGVPQNGVEFRLVQVDNAVAQADGTITGTEKTITAPDGGNTFKTGTAYVGTSEEEGVIAFTGLLFNTVYYYQEVNALEGYQLDSTKYYFVIKKANDADGRWPNMIEVPSGVKAVSNGEEISLVNQKIKGILRLIKAMAGVTDEFTGTFYFTITQTADGKTTYYDKDGKAIAANAEKKAVSVSYSKTGNNYIDVKLAPGTYKVTEVADENGTPRGDSFEYTVTGEEDYTVEREKTVTATVTNTKYRSLKITKSVEGEENSYTGGTFYFTVKGTSGKYYTLTGEAKDTLQILSLTYTPGGQNNYITVSNLLPDTYTVTEVASDGTALPATFGYTVTGTGNVKIESSSGDTVTADVTNKKVCSLNITKEVKVNGGAASTLMDDSYYFVILDSSNQQVGDKVTITVTNGVSTPVTVSNLPAGSYTVKEVNADGSDYNGTNVSVSVKAGTETTYTDGISKEVELASGTSTALTFQNDLEALGKLTVSKVKTGGAMDTFYFTVKDTSRNNRVVKNGNSDVFSITAGSSSGITIENLPAGIYEVTETDESGSPVSTSASFYYSVSYEDNEANTVGEDGNKTDGNGSEQKVEIKKTESTQNTEGTWNTGVVTITNTYVANTELVISGTKDRTTVPNDIPAFSFEIIPGEGSPAPVTKDDDEEFSGQVEEQDGVFTFPKIQFSVDDLTLDKESGVKMGTFTYTVKEVIPKGAVNNVKDGITYDNTVYTITVTVTDNGDGTLSKTVTAVTADNEVAGQTEDGDLNLPDDPDGPDDPGDSDDSDSFILDGIKGEDEAAFTNTYGATGELELSGTKKVDGSTSLETDQIFNFEVTEYRYDAEAATEDKYVATGRTWTGTNVATETNAATSIITFTDGTANGGTVKYYTTEDTDGKTYGAGTYKYVAEETTTSADKTGYVFDSEKAIIVVVSDTQNDGTLNVAVKKADGTTESTVAGEFVFDNKSIEMQVKKTDLSDEEVPGATLTVFVQDSEGAYTELTDEDGTIVLWTSVEGETYDFGKYLEPGKDYLLRETVAPNGYAYTTDITFSVGEDGTITTGASSSTGEDGETVYLVKDSITSVKISKVDITGEEELPGAHLEILDENGNLVEMFNDKGERVDAKWTSTDKPYEVKGLKVAERDSKTGELKTITYILRETVAPDGYAITTDKKFTLDADGKIVVKDTEMETGKGDHEGVLLLNDTVTSVKISKVDITGEEELPDAKLQILEADGKTLAKMFNEKGERVDAAWTSGDKPYEVKGLKAADRESKTVKYILRETVAPDGYELTTDTEFTLDEYGKIVKTGTTTPIGSEGDHDGVLLVKDTMTSVKISKVDVNGQKELPGAQIEILNPDGTVAKMVEDGKQTDAKWTSTEQPKEVKGLKTGVKYTLRETVAPDGYEITTDTVFVLDEKGEIDKTQTTTETKDGVLLVEDTMTSVKISKVDVTDQKELPGAQIEILNPDGTVAKMVEDGKQVDAKWTSTVQPKEVKGLKTGVQYTLRETVAPDGYEITTDTTFVLDEKGEVDKTKTTTKEKDGVLLVEDTKTEVSISKVDIGNGAELEGAKIQILDKDGKVVEEWTSTKEAHIVKGLKTGETYTLRETVAPNGYVVATDTAFVLDEKGEVDKTKTTAAIRNDGVLLIEDLLESTSNTSVEVRKALTSGGAAIGAVDAVYRVALFYDEACTKRAAEPQAITFKNASSSSVVFKDLEVGRTYYVAEVDDAGNQITGGTAADGTVFVANFAAGNKVVTEKDGTQTVFFENEYYEIPDGFYKEGELTVTKKLLGTDGNAEESDEIFYAGIFADAAHTTLSDQVSENIVALDLAGGSEVSETVKVSIGDGETVKLYIAEVDEDGTPVPGAEEFGYEVTVDHSSVTLSQENANASVTITNKVYEKETETEGETDKKNEVKAVKTGDDTPVGLYLALFAAAALAIVILLVGSIRRRRSGADRSSR